MKVQPLVPTPAERASEVELDAALLKTRKP